MYCSKCGNKHPENEEALFCLKCGHKISGNDDSELINGNVALRSNAISPKRIKKIIVISSIVLVTLIAGFIIYLNFLRPHPLVGRWEGMVDLWGRDTMIEYEYFKDGTANNSLGINLIWKTKKNKLYQTYYNRLESYAYWRDIDVDKINISKWDGWEGINSDTNSDIFICEYEIIIDGNKNETLLIDYPSGKRETYTKIK